MNNPVLMFDETSKPACRTDLWLVTFVVDTNVLFFSYYYFLDIKVFVFITKLKLNYNNTAVPFIHTTVDVKNVTFIRSIFWNVTTRECFPIVSILWRLETIHGNTKYNVCQSGCENMEGVRTEGICSCLFDSVEDVL